MQYSYTITPEDKFINVRDVLKNHFLISTRLLNKLIKFGLIYLNNVSVRPDKIVFPSDIISFSMDFNEDSSNIIPIKMNLHIVYEDESFLIINKPSNLAVHPTSYHFTDTLSNGVKFYFDSIGLHKKIRIVNRLDRNTSGLVIIAKNEYVQEFLIRQMKTNNFIKKYIGIVEGSFSLSHDKPSNFSNNIPGDILSTLYTGTINAPISRKPNSIIERCVSPLRRRGNYSL